MMSIGVFVIVLGLATPSAQQPPSPPPTVQSAPVLTGSANPPAAAPQSASPADQAAAKKRRAALRAQAEKALAGFVTAKDPSVQVAACEAQEKADPSCQRVLSTAKRSTGNVARIHELAARAAKGDADASAALGALPQELKDKDPAAAIEAARAVPGPEGLSVVRELLDSGQPEIRELAAAAMAEKDPDQARELVKQAAAGKGRADVGFQAALGLASGGDAASVTQVTGWLPTLQGRDRFRAGEALAKAGAAEGVDALTQIARSTDDELLSLQAAESLLATNPAVADAAVARGLESPNMWVRGAAAALAPRLGDQWLDRVRALLDDPNEWVRLRAAAAVVQSVPRR